MAKATPTNRKPGSRTPTKAVKASTAKVPPKIAKKSGHPKKLTTSAAKGPPVVKTSIVKNAASNSTPVSKTKMPVPSLVRGFFAGVVRGKLKLELTSDKTDGERRYRIGKPAGSK